MLPNLTLTLAGSSARSARSTWLGRLPSWSTLQRWRKPGNPDQVRPKADNLFPHLLRRLHSQMARVFNRERKVRRVLGECGSCLRFNQHPDTQTWAQRAKAAGPDRCVPCPARIPAPRSSAKLSTVFLFSPWAVVQVCKKSLNENHDLSPVPLARNSRCRRDMRLSKYQLHAALRCSNTQRSENVLLWRMLSQKQIRCSRPSWCLFG